MSTQPTIPHYQLYGQQKSANQRLDVHIQTIEAFNEKYGHYHHPHRHPDLYQMVWVTEGHGIHTMDEASYKMRPNCLYTLSPGIVHTCHSNANLKGYILHFSEAFMLQHTQKQAANTFHFGAANPTDSQQITHIYQQIHQEFHQIRLGKERLMQSLISMLLVYKDRLALPAATEHAPNGKQAINQQFQNLVNEYYTNQKKLDFYATALHISIPHLKECIKKATGLTASELIQKRVILEAKRQLIYSQLNISEIAFLLGFADANYFWKYFRRIIGQSPGEFRKAHGRSLPA